MCGDGAFAEDHPGVHAAGQVDDGGGDRAGGGAAIDDEGDLVTELGLDAAGPGAFGEAAEVGAGGGDGEAEFFDDGAADGGFGDAEGDVAGVGGDAEGELGACADDDGERAGPEALGEAVKAAVDAAGELVGLGDVADEERKGFVAGAGFDVVDTVDGAQVYGVDGEAVEGVGGESDDVALIERLGDPGDVFWFRLVRMNAKQLCVQRVSALPVFSRVSYAGGWGEWWRVDWGVCACRLRLRAERMRR